MTEQRRANHSAFVSRQIRAGRKAVESRYGRRMSRISRISTSPMHGVSTETGKRERRTVPEERPKAGVDEEEHNDVKLNTLSEARGAACVTEATCAAAAWIESSILSVSAGAMVVTEREKEEKNSQVMIASRRERWR